MRRLNVVLLLAFATSASGMSREGCTASDTVVQLIKKVVRWIGDGLTIPKP